eukprot:TRINITY_DN17622_c0_g1_i1.p1 TRINITY_DN17622_c0_g1~~TRINITY_DN17622_c0_g1_i1.p1  ORF type:complete len:220 (+),score=38.88 TRINITY_DN17622_c0_g1_i1:74-733(+)
MKEEPASAPPLGGSRDKAYQKLSTQPAAPKFSIGEKRRPNQRRQVVPGPGSYVGQEDFENQTYTFTKGPRMEQKANTALGPGEYTLPSTYDAPKISCTPRRTEKIAPGAHNSTPGPGAQLLPDLLGNTRHGGPKISMTPRRNAKVDDLSYMAHTPGPGEYGYGERVPKKPSAAAQKVGTFGTSRQRARNKAERQGPTPGPGSYCMRNELKHDPNQFRRH